MSLRDYQQQVDAALQPLAKPYWDPLSQLARLTEEVGELARILNHLYGDKPKKPSDELSEMADEIADIIFCVLALANSQGITNLDEAMKRAISKLDERDRDRYARKAA